MAGAIAQDRESCQFPFLVDEKPTFVPGGSAGERSGGVRKVPVVPLARIQSERLRRLALAGGFRLLRSFELDRLDAAARGWQAQMAEDLDYHRRIFDRGDYLQSAAAVRAAFDVDVEDPFEQPSPAHARCFSLGTGVIGRGLGGALWRSGNDFTAQLRVGC